MLDTKVGVEKKSVKKTQQIVVSYNNRKWLDENYRILDKYGIIYKGVSIFPLRDEEGNIKRKIVNGVDYGIKKMFSAKYKYKNIIYNKSSVPKYNESENGSIVFMGREYNLIGIDIDNKDDTIERYEEWCRENRHDRETLIIETANGGLHEYYRLTDEQREGLKDWSSGNGTVYDKYKYIDVKYNNQILFGPSVLEDDNKKEYYYWINYDKKPMILPNFLYEPILEKIKGKMDINEVKYETINNKRDAEYEKVKKLVNILSLERADQYESWLNVGFSLYNINEKYIDIYIEFSKKSAKFKESEVRDKWNEFKKCPGGYTIGSIDYWARNDDPKRYIDIMEGYWKQYNFFSEIDSEISIIFYNLFKDVIKYCGKWYIFEKGIWKKDKEGLKVKKIITTKLMDFYKKKVKIYEIIKKEKPEENEQIKEKIELLKNIIRKLGTENKVNGIMNMSKSNFYDEEFVEKLDMNVNILCFGEYLYDLKNCIWRETLPNDNCSLKCGIERKDINDDQQGIVMKILEDIFVDKEILEFQINNLAMMLPGGNKTQDFYIWQGVGANGKSLLTKYLDFVFGEYYINLPTNLITQKEVRQGGTNSELIKMKSKRVCVFSEPQQNEKLNNSTIKMMTGGDKITAREVFSFPITFKIDAKMIILCNYTFSMEDVCDESIPRRINFIKFESKFKHEPNKNVPYEKLRNDEYMTDDFIDKIKGSFMKILIERYEELSKKEFKYRIPKIVKESKQEFIDENDIVKTFFNEIYEYSENKKDFIQLKDMYDGYKIYCAMNKMKPNNLKLFKTRIILLTPNFKERYVYKDDNNNKKDITSVIINLKVKEDNEEQNSNEIY
jgi:P4 family phage/plasmid primase-like protien